MVSYHTSWAKGKIGSVHDLQAYSGQKSRFVKKTRNRHLIISLFYGIVSTVLKALGTSFFDMNVISISGSMLNKSFASRSKFKASSGKVKALI